MKKFFSIFAVMVAMAFVCPVLTSCSDDDDDTENNEETVDKTALENAISEAVALIEAADPDDYAEGAIEEYEAKVLEIKAAVEAANTQEAVDALLKQLEEATAAFLKKALGYIDEANIIAKWDFNTEDENQVSTGANKWTAVCTAAPAIFGTDAKPAFVEGIEGKAVSLADGAHLVINDYSEAAVTPKDFSISVWVKLSRTYANNYIMSNCFWNVWKLQIQDMNKPFFTFATEVGIADADNELDQSVKEGEWAQVVVVLSLTDHTLTFYVNGEETKVWDAEGKPALAGNTWATYTPASSVAKLPLLIGLSTTEAEAQAAWTWDWTAGSLGAFYGAIDNLALYDVALTAGQVKKLYKDKN